jgi:hypothetical protein
MFDLTVTSTEGKSEQVDRRIESVEREVENMIRLEEELFRETKLTAEGVRTYLAERSHFTDDAWQKIQIERQRVKEQLARELATVGDQRKVERKLRERKKIDPKWLYVR